MVYFVLTALCLNNFFSGKKSVTILILFMSSMHYRPPPPPPHCTSTNHNPSLTFMKYSSRKKVDVHEKERTNNNVVLDKVDTTRKSKHLYGK